MTFLEANSYGIKNLSAIYGESEAKAMLQLIVEKINSLYANNSFPQSSQTLSDKGEKEFRLIIAELLTGKPLQYVLEEAWFFGLNFLVNESVLIPRPETEELVDWILSDIKFPVDVLHILDIGTGSGCIPVALKKRIRKATVWSVDISTAALDVASLNAAKFNTPIEFLQLNILDSSLWKLLPSFDIIVSNPPYIPQKEKSTLAINVSQYEPATALFVPDDNPLIFYETIASFGRQHLRKSGSIYMETHESYGEEVAGLFKKNGYTVQLKKDMQEKNRMVKSSLK